MSNGQNNTTNQTKANAMTITLTPCESAAAALQHADASGQEPISIGNRYGTVTSRDLDRLAVAGADFGYICESSHNHRCPNRLMIVPMAR